MWIMLPIAHATPPPNFALEPVLTGLVQPISIRFLPDGRMLLLHKKGLIYIVDVQQSPAQWQIYMDLNNTANGIESDEERGLLDIAIDPDFATGQPYFYLLYTPQFQTNGNAGKLRVARFTHLENTGGLTSRGDSTSGAQLWQDSQGYDSCCHYGGGIDFGPDGNLWFSTGDHFQGSFASSLTNAGGKIHRITKTGSIPAGNPYADGSGGNIDSIFAYGLRNPFRSRWDLPSGRYFIAEVGGNTQSIAWEDLHVIQHDAVNGFLDSDGPPYNGINFGWPTVEGPPPYSDFPGANIDDAGVPLFSYPHSDNTSAINGGIVYRGNQFPAEYQGAYFYADSTRDFVRYLKFNPDGTVAPNPDPSPVDISNPELISHPFDIQPIGRIVSIAQGPDGALYYVSFTDSGGAYGEPNPSVLGSVRRYIYASGNVRPAVQNFSFAPNSPNALDVTFTVHASDAEFDPMLFSVDFGDGTASAPSSLAQDTPLSIAHTYPADGVYEAVLSVSDSSLTAVAVKTVAVGTPPTVAAISATNSRPNPPYAPVAGPPDTFRFGDTFTFTGTAWDAIGTPLSGDDFEWSISFVRPGNTHPAFGPTAGASIQFGIPVQGQGFRGPVYYRTFVTATDPVNALTTTVAYDITPEKSDIHFDTEPSGLIIQVDGNTEEITPFVLDTLINFEHTITVPPVLCYGDTEYTFSAWSNGETSPQIVYLVPEDDSFLTAIYEESGSCATGPALPTSGLVLHLETDLNVSILSGTTVAGWLDQSGYGNDVVAGGDPQFVVSATPSGQAAIGFDGDDRLIRFNATDPLGGFPTGNADRTLFVVARYLGSTAWGGVAYGKGSKNGTFGSSVRHPSGELVLHGWGYGNDLVSTRPGIGAGWLITSARLEASVATLSLEGVGPIAQFSHSYNTSLERFVIAQEISEVGYLTMDVAAVLLYDRALSEPEADDVEAYLYHKYFEPPAALNTPPVITMSAPPDGATYSLGTLITLSAAASDAEDGNLDASILWYSDPDGFLGYGSSLAVSSLTFGNHVIYAEVTDSGGLTQEDWNSISITAANTPPTVTVTAPMNGAIYPSGETISFQATAQDTQDGNLTTGILWTSNLDGALGTGGSLPPRLLSTGVHTLTASVSDDGSPALTGSHSVQVTVSPPIGSTLPVTVGLVVHLEADDSVLTGTGSWVTEWGDTSGYGNTLYPGGDPEILPGLTPAGLPALHLDGDDKLQRVHASKPLAGLPYANANRSMFLVARYNSTTWWSGAAYGTGSQNRTFGLTVSHPGGQLVLQGYGGSNDLVSSQPGTGAGWLVQSAVHNAGISTLYRNGTGMIAQFSHTYNTVQNKLVIGEEISGLGYAAMDVAALLIYDRALSESERAEVESYLVAKYLASTNAAPVVTITAPADHTSLAFGTAASFSATATDAEDGDLGAALTWTSNLDGDIGTGASPTAPTLSTGTHVVTATAVDSGGRATQASISITQLAPAPITPQTPIALFDGTSLPGFYPWFTDSPFADPNQVFTVSDGILHVSGNGWGALTSENSYRDYVMVLEFRWDERTWAPRLDKARDAGVLIHGSGALGGWEGVFIPSLEVQVTEGSSGDFVLLKGNSAPMGFTSTVEPLDCVYDTWNCRGGHRWNSTETSQLFDQDLDSVHSNRWDPAWQDLKGFRGVSDIDSPLGEWNQMVVVAEDDFVRVYLNGVLVNEASAVFPSEGPIQLQSEFAEYSVRRWELLPLGTAVGPSIQTNALASGIVGTPYAASVQAVGAVSPLIWSVTTGTLPDGLDLNSESGEITGSPTTSGTFAFELEVTDADALSTRAAFTIEVDPEVVAVLMTDGLVARFESDAGVTLGSGATVATWSDQSGRGNDLFPGGDPEIVAELTPTGLPAIHLDGNDELQRLHATQPLSGLPTGNADRTVFVVARYLGSTWWAGVAYGKGSQNKAFGIIVKHPSGELVIQGYGSSNDLVSNTPGIGAGWMVQSATLQSGVATLFSEGSGVIAQFTHTYNTTLQRLVIGEEIQDAGFATMDVAAVLIYDRALTAQEHASVEAYLKAKYLTATL